MNKKEIAELVYNHVLGFLNHTNYLSDFLVEMKVDGDIQEYPENNQPYPKLEILIKHDGAHAYNKIIDLPSPYINEK